MKSFLLIASFTIFTSAAVFAQKSPVFATDAGAIRGYDAVAYFKDSKAVKGDSLLSFSWNGVDWHFANQENLDAFKSDPEKFAPQYGGYCAYGLSTGHKAPTDPQAWMITDGKLYLNYNKNVQQIWLKKQTECIQTADKKWPALKDKE
ncbi:MAG: YHS domain-containing (seleno)protein [Chitinophagaceae bacterium]